MADRKRSRSQKRRAHQQDPIEVWRPVAQPPPARPIIAGTDPTAVIRSLGEPPLPGQGQVATHYLAAVVEQAASLATALAASAGLVITADDDVAASR